MVRAHDPRSILRFLAAEALPRRWVDISVLLNEGQNKILELLTLGERLREMQLAAKVDPSVRFARLDPISGN